jgi:phytoene desaturase
MRTRGVSIGMGQAMSQGKPAIVIGAGFGGMAAALRLRAMGYAVTLIERQHDLGGRGRVFHRNGFVFDAGPTVITAPFLFEELFALFNRRMADYVTLTEVTPWYRMRFEDGRTFDYGGTVEDTCREIAKFSPSDVDGYLALLAQSRRLCDKGFTQLSFQPFTRFMDMVNIVPSLARLRADLTVYQLVSKHLKDDALRQVFSMQPLLVGGNPFQTTCVYSLIHSLERQWGIWFAMGGTGSLVGAFEKLMLENGIAIRRGETVREITVGGSRISGVVTEKGEHFAADTVVCNADPPFVYKNLIASRHRRKWTDRRIEKQKYSMGLFVIYFGTRKQYPDVAHHTILFGPRYRELLADVFDRGILAEDFSLYLHRPTATDPSMAPAGCDTFYVLCPVPNLRAGVDWQVEGPKLRQRIVKYLASSLLPGLQDTITEDFFVTPEYFRDDLLSLYGSGFSVSPIFTQSAWFRFHNESEDVPGLYFVGAGTHPGAGLPGVVSSAKVVEKLIRRERADHVASPASVPAPAAAD